MQVSKVKVTGDENMNSSWRITS